MSDASENGRADSDRRRAPRQALEAIVHYQIGGSEFVNLSSNVSSEGIFIKNFSPPPVGTELRIRVTLPEELGRVPVHLVGKVVRVVEGVGIEERGMGVEFTSVEADNPEAVRLFVGQVYGTGSGEAPAVSHDLQSGRWQYQPAPQDLLRLHVGGEPAPPARLRRQQVLRAVALVLVGALLGGGLLLLWLLLD